MSDTTASRLALFREPRFVYLWIAGAFWNTIQWLELLAVSVYVFDETGSAFLVALMSVLRVLPFAFFGLLAGAISRRIDRRLVMGWSLALMVPVTGLLGWVAFQGQIEIWHIALGAFVSGTVWALDLPLRRPLMGEIVGEEQVGTAMGLDAMSYTASHMLGPVAGGLLLGVIGLEGAFGISAVFYAIAVLSLVLLSHRDTSTTRQPSHWLREILHSVDYLKRDRIMACVMGFTVVFNLWGFPLITMIPVIGKEVLGLDAVGVGLLASAEGTAAFAGTVAIALWARLKTFRRLFLLGTGAYIVCVLVFGWSTWVWVSGAVLFMAGLAGAAFGVMQSALVLLNAPIVLRGHMMGILSVCIGLGPIGFLHLGWLADWLGAPLALEIVGLEGLIGFAVCWWLWPEIKTDQEIRFSPPESHRIDRSG